MVKKIRSLVFIAIISINMTGCQLAKDEDSYKNIENTIGAFVTYTLDGEEDIYYENEIDKKYYGEISEDGDYKYLKFKGLEGESIFLSKEEKEDESYNEILCSKSFQNPNLNVYFEDNTNYNQIILEDSDLNIQESSNQNQNTENKISGTIFVTSKFKGVVNINPIIKEGDKYYTQKQSPSIYIDGENGGVTSSNKNSYSTRSGGSNNETETFTYDIKIETIDQVQRVKIKEMSKDDKVISTKDIKHTTDIYEYKIKEETEYVIVEETSINIKGKEIIKRTIYNRDSIENKSAIHMCAYANEDYLVVPKYLDIIK